MDSRHAKDALDRIKDKAHEELDAHPRRRVGAGAEGQPPELALDATATVNAEGLPQLPGGSFSFDFDGGLALADDSLIVRPLMLTSTPDGTSTAATGTPANRSRAAKDEPRRSGGTPVLPSFSTSRELSSRSVRSPVHRSRR